MLTFPHALVILLLPAGPLRWEPYTALPEALNHASLSLGVASNQRKASQPMRTAAATIADSQALMLAQLPVEGKHERPIVPAHAAAQVSSCSSGAGSSAMRPSPADWARAGLED